MKGKAARIICVGKIRASWWKDACAHYARLIGRWRPVELLETRDADAGANAAERNAREGKDILKRMEKGDLAIAMSEKGEAMDSVQLAEIFRRLDNGPARRVTFIIGGPFGLDERIYKVCQLKLSLSPLTFTHEMARVILLEQIYRAQTILLNMPYHH